jgi:FtsH-binding integral membrane protein
MNNYKDESYEIMDEDISEQQIQQSIRLGFIRKVYGIISFQLLITTIVVYFSIYNHFLSSFMVSYPGFVYLFFFGALFTEIPIICCPSVASKVPLNYVLLLIFTLCESYLVAYITLFYEPLSVLMCAGITLALVIGLTLYAIFTKTDMTLWGGGIACLAIIFFILSIIGIFYRSLFYQTLLNCCGLFLFSIYLMYDVQLVIGKNKKLISTDQYIIGAMMIYIDIISIFIKILLLFGKKKK